MKFLHPTPQDLQQAAHILQNGGIVAVPTETVYGLAGLATNDTALQKIFQAKERPSDHPLIVHLGSIEEAAYWSNGISAVAQQLMRRFWPGPLTLIVPAAPHVSPRITGGQNKVALRIPSHPATLQLLSLLGQALCAPSANRFGRISPTTAQHVLTDLGDRIDAVIDAGPCSQGLESTIIDLSVDPAVILRPGMICAEQLEPILGFVPAIVHRSEQTRTSGLLDRHYAPQTPLHLIHTKQLLDPQFTPPQPCVVLASQLPAWPCRWIEMPNSPELFAQVLYDRLRMADQGSEMLIYAIIPPLHGLWFSIYDRLLRAAQTTRS